MNHLRLAFRQLIKNPGFSAIAIITLALGVGANTAIFSIVNSVLLRPLPYPGADRIMVLNESGDGQEFSVSLPNYEDWKRDNTVFQFLAITRRESRNLSGIQGQEAERIPCAFVSEDFFKVIGISPKLGRTFTGEESKAGGPPAIVISDRLWHRVFARDPDVLGRTIKLHNQGFTVIGVMPPEMTSPQDTDVWFPFGRRIVSIWNDRTIHPMLFAWGRLKPGVTVDQARTEMKGIAARLEKEYPATNARASITVTP
ncbi:MAG: ABC transporter permease, partial [Chthoniobacterales bacterium]